MAKDGEWVATALHDVLRSAMPHQTNTDKAHTCLFIHGGNPY